MTTLHTYSARSYQDDLHYRTLVRRVHVDVHVDVDVDVHAHVNR